MHTLTHNNYALGFGGTYGTYGGYGGYGGYGYRPFGMMGGYGYGSGYGGSYGGTFGEEDSHFIRQAEVIDQLMWLCCPMPDSFHVFSMSGNVGMYM